MIKQATILDVVRGIAKTNRTSIKLTVDPYMS